MGNSEWEIETAAVVGYPAAAGPSARRRFPQAMRRQALSPFPAGRRRRPLPAGVVRLWRTTPLP